MAGLLFSPKALSLLLLVASAAAADLETGKQKLDAGDREGARAVFQALIDADSSNAEAMYQMAHTFNFEDEIDQRIEWLENAVELDPDNSRYHGSLGDGYGNKAGQVGVFRQMKYAGKIKKAYLRAVELDPNNLDARSGLVSYYINAPAIAGGSTDKALEQAEKIRTRDAARGHLAYARVYQSDDEPEKAEQAYRAAIAAAPEKRDGHLGLGVHLTSVEKYSEAMAVYDAWLEDHADDMSVTYQVGRTASISGEFLDRGQQAFEAYLKHTPDPDSPGLQWAHYRLGLIHQHRGQTAAAREQFQAALKVDPDHDQAKKALRKLR